MLHGPEHYRFDRRYMDRNVTVMTGVIVMRLNITVKSGVTWVLHGPDPYRYDHCYMGPNFTVMTVVTWA